MGLDLARPISRLQARLDFEALHELIRIAYALPDLGQEQPALISRVQHYPVDIGIERVDQLGFVGEVDRPRHGEDRDGDLQPSRLGLADRREARI